jgi:UDP-2-acetamido-3-amino-2,3-dideoxy-glucuronate N-acetyltransferase
MIAPNVIRHAGVVIPQPELVNLYGCELGEETRVGPFVEIQAGVVVGARCKISSHSFICSGVVIEDGVFVGHGVMFINDVYPRAVNDDGSLQTGADWKLAQTRIRTGASIGTHATLMGGITVGRSALVGAGAVVTTDVPDYAIVAGVPARRIGDTRDRKPATSMAERPALEAEALGATVQE